MIGVNNYTFNTFQATTKQAGASRPVQSNKLSIWYCNDLHGNTDKMSGVMEAAKAFKNSKGDSAHFLLTAGDNVSGADKTKNEFVLDIMQNVMSIDASAVGNHEIDATSTGFGEASGDKKINFIATNVEFDEDNPLNDVVKKFHIEEEGGVKYGFVGLMPLDFKTCTKKSVQDDLEVMDMEESIEALQEEIDNLKEQGINRIILLSHSGFEVDKETASKLSGVDIIIGGHSHSVVEGASHGHNIVYSKTGEPVVITQAGENGRYYGVLDVEFGESGELIKIANNLIPTSGKKSPIIEYIKDQKMGLSPTIATISSIDEMPKNRRTTPHGWANLVVDSMRSEFNSDVAFLNAANVRKVPTEGKLTQRDVSESVPMKNKLIRTRVTQKQMVDAIKQAAKETLTSTTGEPGFLFASGLTYKVNDKGDLLELNFIDKQGIKNPIDINNPSETVTYDAIYDEFVMMENGEYPHLAPKFPVEHFEFDKDKTAIDYISKMQNKDGLVIADDHRIEIVKTLQPTQLSSSNQKFLNLTRPIAS